MGITTAILRVREHRKSVKFAEVEFLVDSGAVYSLVPGKILDELDIEPSVWYSIHLPAPCILCGC